MSVDPALVDPAIAELHRITPRMVDVLARVAKGMTNAQIGRALFMSEDTVKKHLKRVFQRLQVGDRASAVAVAYDVGVFRTRAQRVALSEQLRVVA